MSMVVAGVDPGSVRTGIVVADLTRRHHFIADASVTAPDDGARHNQPAPAYLAAVTAALDDLAASHHLSLIAVEGVVAPNPHMGRVTNVEPILTAAAVLGVVLAWTQTLDVPVVAVRPGGNGSRPLGTYPEALVAAQERVKVAGRPWQLRPAGKGALKDARSAWDVALAGPAAAQVARHMPGGVYAYKT